MVGGTGRVGGSTIRALRASSPSSLSRALGKATTPLPPLALSVGGRSPENFDKAKARWTALDSKKGLGGESVVVDDYADVGFCALDHEGDPAAMRAAIAAARPDLIIHTAGGCVVRWVNWSVTEGAW